MISLTCIFWLRDSTQVKFDDSVLLSGLMETISFVKRGPKPDMQLNLLVTCGKYHSKGKWGPRSPYLQLTPVQNLSL